MRELLLALTVAALLGATSAAQNLEVRELVLDNGMTWLLVPRTEEPNTVSAGWVAKVGSVDERPGITGISHFFEHMMFKGTTTIGTRDPAADAELMDRQHAVKARINELVWGQQYDRYKRGEIDDPWDPENDTAELRELRAELGELMEAHRETIVKNEFDSIYTNEGGSGMNAFTSEDMTFYFINVPSNKFELWCWMESDRLDDSVFREFYAERDVVHEERRMRLESSPTGELDEQFDAMFWMSSPYSWSPIGWPSDLNSYTREDFDAYFDVYYRPNNLVGVVVGDFDPDVAVPMIESYFGRLERGPVTPPPVVTTEMPQVAERRMIGDCECQPQVEVRYHTVPFNHADSFPLEIMAEVLNGRTGRLYKGLVEGAEIASSARAGTDHRKHAGYFSFSARVKGDAGPDELEAAWYDELQRLQDEPVSPEELEKVQNQVAADSFRSLQSNGFIRLQLGFFAASGGWRYINEAPGRLRAVTVDDIQRVANTYFDRTNRNVASYTRRAGSAPDDGLASLPPEAQAQVKMMLQQFEQLQDVAQLEEIVGRIESGLSSMPEQKRPAMDYVVEKTKERIERLRSEESEG